MGEHLADVLLKTAEVLHWLGKYETSNALTLLSRWLRVHGISTLDALEKRVMEDEAASEAVT